MAVALRELRPLTVEAAVERVELSDEVFRNRCRQLYAAAGSDWVLVWGDREHFGNIHYLSNFDPRFEEAVLLLGPDGRRALVVGNEGEMYAHVVRGGHEVVLCQTFSLMGQKRRQSPTLDEVFRDAGLSSARSVSVVGWKYPEEFEEVPGQNHFVPAYVLSALTAVTGRAELLEHTRLLIDPVDGMRADNEAENIALLEWGASRASDAVARIVRSVQPGLTELQAMSAMEYAGEPMTCHPMFATGDTANAALRSPGARVVQHGDPIFAAVGYWGGLTCRAGVVAEADDDFVNTWAAPYFEALVAWYETVRPGLAGGDLHAAATERLAAGGMHPALNPGHLTATEEWVGTNVQPGNDTLLASGMALQCDVIPAGLPDGMQLNCEDGIALADAELRAELASTHPAVWSRIEARRTFMKQELGITIDDSVLPLSNTPGYFAPAFLAPDRVLVAH